MPAKAFHLDVRDDRTATVTFDLPDRRVNLFNQAVLTELRQLIGEVSHREEIGCLVLLSGKPGNFIAGADVDGIAGVTVPYRRGDQRHLCGGRHRARALLDVHCRQRSR